ncbi:class I SAM-dependent methyltransferase [Ramlibacter sp.]|uniref:class I SAM-dependent methyltransferase n=1 Tax=Ramlibacter sp. TaxID=1917967 RepID=UPI002D238146|nr:class I SAM-dependent methyltransferase [Ramlibacter sp.]HYD76244.1 class I SAM-dependent methyltransferase [Ramlibacter sp.]
MSAVLDAGLVTDEAAFMAQHLPLVGARIVELGCGKAELARRLLEQHGAAEVTGFEVDERQHAANLAAPPFPGLRFAAGGAEAIPLPDACCDGVMMLKSLHHVPMPLMDQALREIARVLVPGGWLYVSEPVYAGEFNELVKRFHDEGEVRAAAYAALQRAAEQGVLAWEQEVVFDTPLHFRDWADFEGRIVLATHADHRLAPELERQVREHFQRHVGDDGARFVRQMRINFLARR